MAKGQKNNFAAKEVVDDTKPEGSESVIDFSKCPGGLVLIVDPILEDFVDEARRLGGQFGHLRKSFYGDYVLSKLPKIAYPHNVTDGFIKQVMYKSAEVLSGKHTYNIHRLAVNKYAGTLNNESEYFAWIDRLLHDNIPEFFTFGIMPSANSTLFLGGVRYENEASYLRYKFKNVVTVGTKKYEQPWMDIVMPNTLKPKDTDKALEEVWTKLNQGSSI